MKIKITFTEPLLGSTPKGDVYEQWIATRTPDPESADEETATAPDLEKGVTGFHRTEAGEPRFCMTTCSKAFLRTPAQCCAGRRIRKAPS